MKKVLFILISAISFIACEKTEIGTSKPIFSNHILEGYFVVSSVFDNNGNAWFGTFEQGLIRLSANGTTTVYNSTNSIIPEKAVIHDVETDSKGNVWFSCDGLMKFDGVNFTHYDNSNTPMPENNVRSIVVDWQDNVWFSSCRFKQGGLVKYDGKNWNVFTPENSSLPVNMINDVKIDKKGDVWLAMSETVGMPFLIKIANDKWTLCSEKELGFTPYFIRNIEFNSANKLCGTIDYTLSSAMANNRPNLFTFDGTTSQQLTNNNISVLNNCLAVDKKDNIWLAESGKLMNYNGVKWTETKTDFKDAFDMAFSKDGKLYVGSGNGVFIYTIQ